MTIAPFASLSVIGGGAWGTALAHLAAANGVPTKLWAREAAVVESVNARHENAVFLPGAALDPRLTATGMLAEAAAADALLFVTPVQFTRAVLAELCALGAPPAPDILLCSKGVEQKTGAFPANILREVWPAAHAAALSGPSFARDVVRGMPTAVTIAAADEARAKRWVRTIGAPHFRPYYSDDLVGVELGGAIKNVLAIAAGVVDGRGLGESARAALIARGFAEFQRLGAALGARKETMAGLSGLGDLVLTASSPASRNMSLGIALGRGESLASILSGRLSVAEGVATASAIVRLAAAHGVETPICAAVADLVAGARTVDAVIADLLARPFRAEAE